MNFSKDKNLIFEELHIRHLNLLIDLKNEKENSWFYKMAILNTLNDLRIILNTIDGLKNKCTIAIEDKKIREKERQSDFSDEFISLARSVYYTNDKRADIKKKINMISGSELIEEKSYAKY